MTIQFGADFFIFIMEENFRLLKHSLKNAIRKACQIPVIISATKSMLNLKNYWRLRFNAEEC